MLYLIDHPESTLGPKIHHADLDASLSIKGIGAVGPISKVFSNRKLDLIVTPSVARNSEAAVLLASLTGASIFVDEGLRTWRQGAFSGMPHDKVKAAMRPYLRNPDVKVPQGESANHFFSRWKRTFKKYQGMSQMSRMNIGLVLNSISISAVAVRFKPVELEGDIKEGSVWEVGPGLTLKEL